MKKVILWLFFVAVSVIYLTLHPPILNTDILKLISDPKFELVSKASKNNIIRIVFHGSSDSINAANDFKQSLPKELKLKSFEDFKTLVSPAYFLTLKQQQEIILPNAADKISEQIISKLTSPLGSFYSQFLEIDPLLMLPDRYLEISKSIGYKLDSGVIQHGANTAVLIVEVSTQKIDPKLLSENIEQKLNQIRNKYKNLDIRWSGMLRFASSSASKMENDLNIISTVASILTALTVLYCFRSIIPFVLCFLAVFIGMLGGIVTLVIVNGSIHLLTLGFGCSLLGACVDYPLHYFCAKQFENNKNVTTSISLGALTTVLSFVILLFSGFNGLIEISLFSIGSILASWATVYCLFPIIKYSKKSKDPFRSLCIILSNWTAKYGLKVYPAICAMSIFGMLILNFNDDIRLLQPADKKLIEDEIWIQKKSGLTLPSGLIFVSGQNKEELEQNLEEATGLLKHFKKNKLIKKFEGKYRYLPTISEQRSSVSAYEFLIENSAEELRSALEKIGYEQRLIEKAFEVGKASDFTDEYELGLYNNKLWSFISIYGAKEPKNLKTIFEKYGFYYDHVKEISNIFENYRVRSFFLVLISYFLIFSWFNLRYGVQLGTRNFIPAIITAVLTLSTLAFCGIQFNFFGLLALIIVLGLTIDYSIFYLEGENKIIPTSILLSSISTMITFGLLAFSSTPVLANFGLIVAVGIFFATFLTYLPFCEK